MTAADLSSLLAVDLTGWEGLPGRITVADLAAAYDVDEDQAGTGLAGDPPVPRRWLALSSDRYSEGVLAWCQGDEVVLVEGLGPIDHNGDTFIAPDMGGAEAMWDTPLGRLWLEGGERVYAARGLALRVNPANGLLLGVLGFAPTTVADYRSRLRPHREPRRLLASAREVIR